MASLTLIGSVLAAALVVAPLAKAGVITVDPGGDAATALQSAVLAAAEDDTLLLLPGAWQFPEQATDPVNVVISGKGLTLVAAAGTHPVLCSLSVLNLPAGSRFVLRGIDFVPIFGGVGPLLLDHCAGSVWIEGCSTLASPEFSGGTIFSPPLPGAPGAGVNACSAVSFVRCHFIGGHGAPEFFSPFGDTASTDGGAGLRVQASSVTVHDCELQGGMAGAGQTLSAGARSGDGAAVLGASGVLLAGCSLTGADQTGSAPGNGLKVSGTSAAVLLRDCAAVAGAGSVPALPIDAAPGLVTMLPAPARSLEMPMSMHELSAGTMVIDGVPGDLVALFASFGGAVQFFPGKQGAFLLASPLSASFILGHNPVGHWTIPFGTPALPAAVDSVTVLLQLVVHDGTQVLFEGGSATVLLDSTLP